MVGRLVICDQPSKDNTVMEFLRKLFSSSTRELEAANLKLESELSDCRRREEELRKLASLVENGTDLIAMASLEGEIVYVNAAGQDMVGLTGNEHVRRTTIPDYVAAEDMERFQREVLPALFKDGKWEGETLFKHFQTGESVPMWQHTFFVTDEQRGQRLAIATICRDLRERKRGEEGMRKLSALVENSTEFIGFASVEGDVLFVNAAGQAIVGLSGPEQVLASTISDYIAEPDVQRFINSILPEVFRDGRWEGETHFKHFKTGASISMSQTIFFITEEGRGQRLALATICRDITERKRSEERLQNAQAQLAHITRLSTMGEVVASIAHEVNQPLTGIITTSNACLRWLNRAEPDLDRARIAVERILKDGTRAGEIISRIRALSVRTSTKQDVFEVNPMISEVVEMVQTESRQNNVSVQMEFTDGLPHIVGDRVQLQQVILNLMINGIEAMKSVEDRPKKLVIETRRGNDGQVWVAVQDSGIGLAPQNIDRIFDAFYTTKREGMGMGLSISRSIIENHNGRLWAAPIAGPGARFEFTLPARC